MTEATPEAPSASARRAPGTAVALLAVVVLSVVGTLAGAALAPSLVDTHPLWLLALDARTRHLALTAAVEVSLASWASMGARPATGRRSRVLPPRPLPRRSCPGMAGLVHTVSPRAAGAEDLLRRFGWPLVAVAPHGAVCFAAGTTGLALHVRRHAGQR